MLNLKYSDTKHSRNLGKYEILNLRTVRIEREDFQLKGPENILTKS